MAREPSRKEQAEAGADEGLEARIRRRAYQIWEEQGWPHGRAEEHWLQAEREIAQPPASGAAPAAGEDSSGAAAPAKERDRSAAPAKPRPPAARRRRGS